MCESKTVKIRQTNSGWKSASFTHLTLQPELGVFSSVVREKSDFFGHPDALPTYE
jgi:hypothetical protein